MTGPDVVIRSAGVRHQAESGYHTPVCDDRFQEPTDCPGRIPSGSVQDGSGRLVNIRSLRAQRDLAGGG